MESPGDQQPQTAPIDLRNPKWIALGLVLVFAFRLIIHAVLYQRGFIALTADEFGRTFIAAEWATHPSFIWNGIWLPFHSYLFGSALLVKWELLWLPRLISLLVGGLSILLMYWLTLRLFGNRLVGLISAALLSLNPAHIWLSSVPLTEIITTAFILAALWAFVAYLQQAQPRHLLYAASALLLANGFRFEPWLFSILFSLTLLGMTAFRLVRRKITLRGSWLPTCAALIPWLVPLAWVLGNYIATHNLFFIFEVVTTYNLKWYGEAIAYGNYLKTFWKIDPAITILGLPAILLSLRQHKSSTWVRWYAAACLMPLAAYLLLQAGHVQPPGNYIRYLALFLFLFYPIAGYLIKVGMTSVQPGFLRWTAFVLIMAIISTIQLNTAFHFSNDPSTAGLAVGQEIRALRQSRPEASVRPVIIELSYWQYLAILVGANDIHGVIYDRQLDIAERQTQSLILSDPSLFNSCLAEYNVSYVILKDPQLRSRVESEFQLKAEREVNSYAFYPVEAEVVAKEAADMQAACPLSSASLP